MTKSETVRNAKCGYFIRCRQQQIQLPSVWEVYKFIHVNTVAPFGTFRTKIRKWKKLML
ncbi:ClbS/DfsB family four-helix bundle protein [Treponema phagedenis]|uniref:ClbS/DfsB family four-helix bundle protein n=1 Tax=Treponema phagedenis TaxID=162 RepID=UPI000AEF55A9|nr:cytoplasmic protein [Treponema phagedenis]